MGATDSKAAAAARGEDWDNIPDEPGAAPHVPLDEGSNETVEVFPPDGKVAETAKALNDAAEGRESVVKWTGNSFEVPRDVADAANLPDDTQTIDVPEADTLPTRTVVEGTAHQEGWTPETPEFAQTADQKAADANGDAVPTERNTVAEIEDYAAKHNIDLTGASTKPEKVAKIDAAQK